MFVAPLLIVLIELLTESLICSAQSGTSVVLVGGALSDNNNAVWGKIIELAGGEGQARIGVVSAASGDPNDSGSFYVDLLISKGVAEAVFIPIYEDNIAANEDPDVIADINRMTGFFFSGGDQARIINSFYHNPHTNSREASSALTALRERFTAGAVISGSSAGAMCHNQPVMLMGGYSYEALVYGSYEWDDSSMPRWTVEYDPRGGLEILDNFIVDTHYSERGREGRLARLVADSRRLGARGTNFGIGVDEDTAIVLTDVNTNNEKGEVFGPFGVMIYDLRNIREDTLNGYYRVRDVITHYLTEGDTINFSNMNINYPSWKTSLRGREMYNDAAISRGIFDGNRDYEVPEFVYVATRLFDSRDYQTYGDTYESGPKYRVMFFKNLHSRGEGFEGRSPTENRSKISYQYLILDMYVSTPRSRNDTKGHSRDD